MTKFLIGRWALGVERWTFSASTRMSLFDLCQVVRKFLVIRFRPRSFGARFAIALMDKFDHFIERGAGEKDFVHAFAFHACCVIVSNRAAAAAEDLDFVRAFFAQKIDDSRKKLDVPAVVA